MNSLEKFCDNKKIAIVGNSSRILNHNYGDIIDSHDVVVRINHAPKYIAKYPKNVGTKTTIMSYGLSRLDLAKEISNKCNPQYNLFLIRCNGEIKDYKPYSLFKNPFHGDIEEYRILKSNFAEFKPSTGIVTINYFVNNINFSKLNLFGFDFFTTSSTFRKNEFGSYLYKDHNGLYEQKFVHSILNDKVVIFY
jgi:hypothetical protein